MRSVGGGAKDSYSSSSYSGDSHTGSSRDGEHASSAYRERRDGGRGFGSGSTSYSQYQNNSNSCQYGGSRVGSAAEGVAGGQAPPPPPPPGPQPLMAQQFNPPQPVMGLMGHAAFQFDPASGRK